MSIVYIGVDGGLSGAIAFYHPDPSVSLDVIDIPKCVRYLAGGGEREEVDIRQLRRLLSVNLGHEPGEIFALIERGQGDRKQSAARAYTYGFASGEIAAAIKLGVGVESVGFIEALAWKRWAGLVGQDKEASRILASSLFGESQWPKKSHHNRAEAALIARYLAEKGLPKERPAPAPKRKTAPKSKLIINV